MLCVDTSVWIDFFADRSVWQVDEVVFRLTHKDDICTCGIVLAEVLQGIRYEKDYWNVKKMFEDILYLHMTRETFIRSAELYRGLRKKGITVRKPVDCMIAAVCIQYNVPLLHADKDFDPIARHFNLKVVTRSSK